MHLFKLCSAQNYGTQNYGAQSYGASIIDNEIIELPQIQCTETGVTFQIRTKYPFRYYLKFYLFLLIF